MSSDVFFLCQFKKLILVLILCIIKNSVFGQFNIDSSETLLRERILSDSNRIELLTRLAYEYNDKDTLKANAYLQQTISIVEKLNSPISYGNAYHKIGFVYYERTQYRKAVEYAGQAIVFFYQDSDTSHLSPIINCYTLIGHCYLFLGVYNLSLKNYIEASKIQQKFKHLEGLEDSYGNIANILMKQRNFTDANKYLNKKIEIDIIQGDSSGLAGGYGALGNAYHLQDNFDSSLYYHERCAKIREILGDSVKLLGSYINLSSSYLMRGENSLSYYYIRKAILLNEYYQDRTIEAEAELIQGKIQKARKNYDLAILHQKKAQLIASANELYDIEKDTYKELSDIYERVNDYKEALYWFKEYRNMEDTLSNEELDRQLNELRISYEVEKKEKEYEDLQKENQIKDLELSKEKSIKYNGYAISFFIALSLGFFIFLFFREKKVNDALSSQIFKYNVNSEKLNKVFDRFKNLNQQIVLDKSIADNDLIIFKEYLKSSLDLIQNARRHNETIKVKRIRKSIEEYYNKIKESLEKYSDNLSIKRQLEIELAMTLETLKQPQETSFNDERKTLFVLLLNIFSFLILNIFIQLYDWSIMEKWTYIVNSLVIVIDMILAYSLIRRRRSFSNTL